MQKFWGILFGVVMSLAFLTFVIAPFMPGWWLPKNVASYGGGIDALFYLILAITSFFFVLTEAILVYGMLKFIARPGEKSIYTHGHHRLETLWTIIPGVILFFLALWQVNVWAEVKFQKNMPKPDRNVQQMEVTARQWEWRVRYPSPERIAAWDRDEKLAETFGRDVHADDVHAVNEIHVWQGSKVLVHLNTRDVLHSFFLPNLRIKQDALPGKTIPVWFEATESNTVRREGRWVDGIDPNSGQPAHDYLWELACAEFCGTRHSFMRGRLFVHGTKSDFLAWLRDAQARENATQPPETKKTNAR